MDKTNIDNVKESVYTSLKELGLKDLEINLYTTSLTLGPSPISVLAKHLLISRPNVYKVIRTLESHGLSKVENKSKYARDFMVEPPTVILEKIREKKEVMIKLDHEIVTHLPDLLATYQQGAKTTKIKILQGKEQYLMVLAQILEEAKDENSFFGSVEDFIGFISWEAERDWIKKRVKKNIFMKSLLLPCADAELLKKTDAEQLRETRILKMEPVFKTAFHLFANKMVIWQPKVPLAVLVEDKYIIEMFTAVFNMMWEKAK